MPKPAARPTSKPVAAPPTGPRPTGSSAGAGDGFWFFLRQPAQRRDLWGLAASFALLYAVVHYCYPYPLITEDSPNYVKCALDNTYGGYRPMGYSWFLQGFHFFSGRIVFVGATQYWLYALATAYFLLTVKYFFPPRRPWLFYLFAGGMVLSPVALYLTHWLMSDSVFAALTLGWLSTGLWLLRRVSWLLAALHVAALVLAIQVRFIGLFYPFFTAAGLLLAHRWAVRALAVSAASLFAAYLVYHSVVRESYRLFRVESFSGFSGWAAANNATAILPYIQLDPQTLAADPELEMVHRTLAALPDTLYSERNVMCTSFIWSRVTGGKLVMVQNMPLFSNNYLSTWIYTGEQLNRYASYLVRHYPLQYARYFLWMNFRNMLHPVYKVLSPKYHEAPATGIFAQYYDLDGVTRFTARYDVVAHIQPLLSVSALVLWALVALAGAVAWGRRRALQLTVAQRRAVGWLLGFLAAYLAASLVAHPVHLRYLLPVHGLQLFVLYLAAQALLPGPSATTAPGAV